MNGKALQVKNAALADNARSKASSLEKGLFSAIQEIKEELAQVKESELDLNLSNVARRFGFRNQKSVKALQESYNTYFADMPEERSLVVQLALADVKKRATIRNRAWKCSVQKTHDKVKEQLEEQKVATDANALIKHLSELFSSM
ncbi:uncharacterized protein EI90DRAFT_3052672 [Cantharellus anzutake]|uniref:uncharacterized protein n=1 Tax=Cantharellus anzutake TaxID=1750568 RepID=UPI001908EC37|nr:uncharacterized protein EI90DRAFT_3052672 [Cantharellus anzutake]KAF8333650.1 hypothetical protein EI90DRAFT_3052672 [Cantharellus anzutake]